MNKELTGKICLVTGGSRGIGRAIVSALADAGADVAFTFQNSRDQSDKLAQEIQSKGVRCRAFQANVAISEEMEKVVNTVVEELGPIEILVNNAGISRDKSFLKMTK